MSKSLHPKGGGSKGKSAGPKLIQKRSELFLIIAAVILAGIPFCLGKYFEFNSPGPFDSGANVYSAAHILAGAEIGVEEKPSADTGTLLVNILGVKLFGFNEFGPKMLQGIMQAVALIIMFIAMRKCFCTLSASIAVIISSVCLSSPLIAKFGNVKEQYMIACMVAGISFYLLYLFYNKWFFAAFAGGLIAWAPLFKVTGASATGALGLFVLLGAVFRNRTVKQTLKDILFLLLGVIIAIGPLYIWIIFRDVRMGLPYSFAWNMFARFFESAGAGGGGAGTEGYASTGRTFVSFTEQCPRVLRYYQLFILPVSLALGSIFAGIIRFFMKRKVSREKPFFADRVVLLLVFWWILDMAFVWISPRSYEQYYLPLTASGAMLGGYLTALFWFGMKNAARKRNWIIAGLISLLVMFFMTWHIFFGISKSPHTGRSYGNKRKGYLQKYQEISRRRAQGLKGYWEAVGDYIRNHSEPDEKIYVWGWYPGIYVRAQRFSSATKAFSITRETPNKLKRQVDMLLSEFGREKPKFIVDSRKLHIPTNRPPYELWPIAPQGFMGLEQSTFLLNDKRIVDSYDSWWTEQLREAFGDDEAERYKILKPFRQFVMDNYEIVEPRHWVAVPKSRYYLLHRMFGTHVLFRLKEANSNIESY